MWSGDSAPGQPVRIDDLPIGTPLAVTLRSGQTIAGCEDISGLFANEQRTVRVVAEDLPTRYASQDLNLTLNVISNVALQQHFNTNIGRLLGDWDNAPSDIDFVLDAMRAQLKDEPARLSFDDQRDQDGWSEQLGVALRPELAAHGLLDAAQRSLQSAVARWLAGKNFAGRLSFPSDASATALFQLATVGEVAASKVGFPSTHLVQVTREPADHLQLSFSFYFVQSQLFTGLSNSPTLLQDFVDCDRLAATLSNARTFAFSDCDQQCTAQLCEIGLTRAWQRLEQASLTPSPLPVTVAASITVDADLRPSGITGGWTGTLAGSDGAPLAIFGDLSGTSTPVTTH